MLGSEITALLEALPAAAVMVDANDRLTFCNAAAASLLDAGRGLLGSPLGDLVSGWPVIREDESSAIRGRDGALRDCHVREVRWPVGSDLGRTLLIEPAAGAALADAAARDANLRLQYVIEMLPQALCVFDAEERYVLWNQKYAELYPDIADHLVPGMRFEDILQISLSSGSMPEVVADKKAWLAERMRKFRQPSAQEEQRLRSGRWVRHDDRRTPDGGAIGMRVDITDLKQREEWLHQLFDANPMPMLLCDSDSLSILEANRAAVEFYGFDREHLLSKHAIDLQVEEEAGAFAERLRSLEGDCDARTVWRQKTVDGRVRHVLVYVRLLQDGAARQILLSIADISDRVRAEREANYLANHDSLTGLPNRMHFYTALTAALDADGPDAVIVLCLDLDGFKPVNDTLGHAAGDEVLKMVADRLQMAARQHMAARLGGDEFAILVVGKEDTIPALAARCIGAFEKPFPIKGLPITLGISIGVAVASASDSDGESLIRAADKALYIAKAEGKNTWRVMAAEPRPIRTFA